MQHTLVELAAHMQFTYDTAARPLAREIPCACHASSALQSAWMHLPGALVRCPAHLPSHLTPRGESDLAPAMPT